MKPRRIWITACVLLALIWGGVALVMQQTSHLVSWPEKVIELADGAPWLKGDKSSPEERQKHLSLLITNFNRLDAQQRHRTREEGQASLDKFFASLTEDEQKQYVDRTVEPYFESISRGLKLMPQEERKRLVGRIRNEMKSLRTNSAEGDRLSDQDREFLDVMIADDPILYLREAPTQMKMELAPALEEMGSRIQGMRR